MAHAIGAAVRDIWQPPRVGLLVAGFEVPHLHVHVFPAWDMAAFDFANAAPTVDDAEQDGHRDRLRAALRDGRARRRACRTDRDRLRPDGGAGPGRAGRASRSTSALVGLTPGRSAAPRIRWSRCFGAGYQLRLRTTFSFSGGTVELGQCGSPAAVAHGAPF